MCDPGSGEDVKLSAQSIARSGNRRDIIWRAAFLTDVRSRGIVIEITPRDFFSSGSFDAGILKGLINDEIFEGNTRTLNS